MMTLQFFTGSIEIPNNWIGDGIAYKYVIVNSNGEHWELLHTAFVLSKSQHTVNRYLNVHAFNKEKGKS